ncbi:MAG TPA: cupin domain-containing protein [Usitatibacter sp.]|nr:cupin domain-containing protein [Usitatibacter sp.]
MEKWKTGVRVVRGASLEKALARAGGRATAIDFAGIGGTKTWIGAVKMPADAVTGAHHHGRHEVAIYMTSGRLEIRWGDRLDYCAEIGPGDFAYFEPFVPHQERNLSRKEAAAYLAIRSDNERIVVPLDVAPIEPPEEMFAD